MEPWGPEQDPARQRLAESKQRLAESNARLAEVTRMLEEVHREVIAKHAEARRLNAETHARWEALIARLEGDPWRAKRGGRDDDL
jgi:hypothetical protein